MSYCCVCRHSPSPCLSADIKCLCVKLRFARRKEGETKCVCEKFGEHAYVYNASGGSRGGGPGPGVRLWNFTMGIATSWIF